MGKFSKRLNKINKNFRNILVVGSAFGNLEELLNDVATVFILYPKDESLRRKNLIYRETIESTFTIPEVDFVIIDKNLIHVIPTLLPLWRACYPFIMIEGDIKNSEEHYKFLKSNCYKIIDIHKHYHLWKN